MKKILTISICAAVLSVASSSYASAADVSAFSVQHLTNSEGLCSQQIYSVRQTSDGAVWWASKSCIERYNGVSVKCYSLDAPIEVSYLAGRFWRLYLSSSGTLYAYDNKGEIFEYNNAKDAFFHKLDLRAYFGAELIVNDIFLHDDGWYIAAGHGVFRVNDDKVDTIDNSAPANAIVSVAGKLHFCTTEGVKSISHANPIYTGNVVSAYYDDKNSNLWLGCFNEGVKVVSYAKNGKAAYVSDVISPNVPIRNPVRSICAYDEQTVLLGVDGAGVFQVERVHADGYEASLLFDANNGRNGVLGGNGVYSVLCDVWGGIIVGTYSGGIDIAHPIGMASKIFRHQQNNLQTILNDHVNSVVQLPDGKLVMGTDNGVSIYDQDANQWVHSECSDVVIDLCVLSDGTLAAATYGRGVLRIHPDGNVKQLYSVGNGILKDDYVYCIYEDNERALWMGCLDGQLVHLTHDGPEYYDIHNVKDMLQLPDGRVAVGTASGLFMVDSVSGQVEELNYFLNGGEQVSKYVCTLYLDGTSHLWIGTDGGGVYVYSLSSNEIQRNISTAEGLPSNTISSICKDVYDRILIATDAGLAYVDPELSGKVVDVNYGYNIDREYVVGAVAGMQNGQVLYGTTTGALIINPGSLKELDYVAKLNLIGLERYGEIRQEYCNRTFNLNFECINLSNQDDIAYCYRLGDGEWSELTVVPYIQFLNMSPGDYVLTLRSVSRNCGTVLDERVISMHIGRPWWGTWWMRVIYIGLILLAFYGCWYLYKLHTQYMHIVVNSPKLLVRPASRKDKLTSSAVKDEAEEGKNFIQKATDLIMTSIADPDFSIEKLCREMAMSRTMFYLKLKTYTGKSPQDFIRIIRLERAASLLRTGVSVAEAAEMTGFDNPKYFSTVFKKYFGISPSKYR